MVSFLPGCYLALSPASAARSGHSVGVPHEKTARNFEISLRNVYRTNSFSRVCPLRALVTEVSRSTPALVPWSSAFCPFLQSPREYVVIKFPRADAAEPRVVRRDPAPVEQLSVVYVLVGYHLFVPFWGSAAGAVASAPGSFFIISPSTTAVPFLPENFV